MVGDGEKLTTTSKTCENPRWSQASSSVCQHFLVSRRKIAIGLSQVDTCAVHSLHMKYDGVV